MNRHTLQQAAQLGMMATLVACGSEEMFKLELGGTEHPLDAVAVARFAKDDQQLSTPVVVGDLDGDGIADAVATSMAATSVPPDGLLRLVPQAYVLYGGSTVRGAIDLSTLPSLTELSMVNTIVPVGDVDGDGLADFLVTSSRLPPNAKIVDPPTPRGAYLVYGSRTRLAGATRVSDAGVLFDDASPGPGAPAGVGPGDLDGDGLADFAIGTGTAAPGVAATIFVIYGKHQRPSTTLELAAAADATIVVPSDTGNTPELASVGDVDGDGRGDFLVGTSKKNPSANAYDTELRLVRGRAARLAGSVALGEVAATLFVADEQPTRWLRFGAALGDLDGDGLADFALDDAPPVSPDSHVQRVFYGRPGGFPARVNSSDADATLAVDGGAPSYLAAGDVDGDGERDLLVGDPFSHDRNGALHVLTGTGARLSGTIDVVAHSTTYVSAPRHATNCAFADGPDCVVHELAGAGVAAGEFTGDHRTAVLVSAGGFVVPSLGVHGSSNDRLYVLSLPASARP